MSALTERARLRLGPHSFVTAGTTLEDVQRLIDEALSSETGEGWLEAYDPVGGRVMIRVCSGVPLWIEEPGAFLPGNAEHDPILV